MAVKDILAELQEATGYDPEAEGSVDDLIEYKNALEDALAGACAEPLKFATEQLGDDGAVAVPVVIVRRAQALAEWATGQACARSHSEANIALEDRRARLANALSEALAAVRP